jgi:hypothetical protein
VWAAAEEDLRESMDVSGAAALAALAIVVVFGIGLRAAGIDEKRLANASVGANELTRARGFDIIVPRRVLGFTMLAGLVALSVVACFAYYPPPGECLEEIALARAECLSAANSGDTDHALFWLPVWEEWSRRLEVGTFLRHGEVRPYQRMQGYLIRKKLELLEHELEHEPLEPDEVRAAVRSILLTNTRWVQSFRDAP